MPNGSTSACTNPDGDLLVVVIPRRGLNLIDPRLYLAPATPYAVGLSIGIAMVAVLCLLSLISMSRELTAVTADLAPISDRCADEPTIDLGVGDTVYALVEPAAAGPYRSSATVEVRATGDLAKVRAMMRHTLWGAVALAAFATTTLAVAEISLHRGR